MQILSRFVKLYDDLIEAGLSHIEATLYGHLERFAGKDGECFPSHALLASKLKVNERQVRRLLRTLRECGLIRWTQRGHRSNSYDVLPPDRTKMSAYLSAQTGQKCPPRPDIHVRHDRTPMSGIKDSLKRTTEKRSSSASAAASPGTRKAAAAADENDSQKAQTNGHVRSIGDDLLQEIAANHPKPGFVPQAGKLLRAILDVAEHPDEVVEQIRTSHKSWCEFWTLNPQRALFLHYWFESGEYMNPPSAAARKKPVEAARAKSRREQMLDAL